MIRLAISDARTDLATIVNRVAFGGERILLHRHDKELAVLISLEDAQLLERLIEEEEDRIDNAEADRLLAELKTGREKAVTLKEYKAIIHRKKAAMRNSKTPVRHQRPSDAVLA
ncbi:MAG: type II toxin-antitoxin system Phd/YefM family antitoxin [Candidatus Sumerlaeota bacterium]|nr:type II toxin-antitoxin system Phd/YefM family antitoxin [Candidatus Sumerlaeota bacterium]